MEYWVNDWLYWSGGDESDLTMNAKESECWKNYGFHYPEHFLLADLVDLLELFTENRELRGQHVGGRYEVEPILCVRVCACV